MQFINAIKGHYAQNLHHNACRLFTMCFVLSKTIDVIQIILNMFIFDKSMTHFAVKQ